MKVSVEKLRERIVNSGLSVQEISRKSGLHRLTVDDIINGGAFDYLTLWKLSHSLGCMVSDILLED